VDITKSGTSYSAKSRVRSDSVEELVTSDPALTDDGALTDGALTDPALTDRAFMRTSLAVGDIARTSCFAGFDLATHAKKSVRTGLGRGYQ
jgi:midasin (ATPase involved in ribosome maturation)